MPANLRPTLILDARPAAALGAAATENVPFPTTCPMRVIDVHAVGSATVGGSTAQLLKDTLGNGAFVAVTAAITMAVSGDVQRAANCAVASSTVTATDVLRSAFVDGGGAGANGNLYARMVMLPVTGN